MVATASDAARGCDGVRARTVIALTAALTVVACATPAERIIARLEAAGVPGTQARCMGNRLAARLTLAQMSELNRAVKSNDGEKLTIGRLARRLGDADPALVAKLIETGIGCAF